MNANKKSPLSKFVIWIGGAVIAPVLTAVLIYRLTNPTPPPPPSPSPTPAPITFEGMVITETNAPLKGARVSFDITDTQGGPYLDLTDEHGSYRADFAGLKPSSRATVRVEAIGFQPSPPKLLNAIQNDNRADFILKSVPPPVGAPPTPTPVPVVHSPIYVRRLPTSVIRVSPLNR
ncbi:MAG TPA: carboxypeptidase-like regulatory domain-containing protein [Candidatus Angelobacter sp.]|nr:carboxypeptidase-like regulatory domain-containing protein [Candidatus Angelobacter sp.]